MGQVLHGNATTTQAIRRAIQDSQESLIKLSKRFGINPKLQDKWRKRSNVEDLKADSTPPAQPSYRWKKRPSSWPFVAIVFCLWMIVSTPSSPPSPI